MVLLILEGDGYLLLGSLAIYRTYRTQPAFIYSPPVGFTGADTFDYQVCDNGTPLPSECSTAQTVTINVSDMIWFIDNALVAAGNGTLATPFNTLAGFEAINGNGGSDPGAGDCIFLDTGSGNYTGGVTLENTQILVGEGASAGLASVCGVTLPTHSNSLPATSGTDPTIANAGGKASRWPRATPSAVSPSATPAAPASAAAASER